jgi:hypothetical protein
MKSVELPDPRFTDFVGMSSGNLQSVALGGAGFEVDVAGLLYVAEGMERLSLLGGIREYLVALLPDWDAPRIEAVSARLGLSGGAPVTLEEAGRQVGLTRERIRQLEAKAEEAMGSYATRPYIPQLDRAMSLVADHAPLRGSDLVTILLDNEIDRSRIDPYSLKEIATFFGRDELVLVRIERELAIGTRRQSHLETHGSAVLKVARKQAKHYGASNLQELGWELEENGISLSADQLAGILRFSSRATLRSDGWFSFGLDKRTKFVGTTLRMLSVNSPLPIRSLREGLRRRYTFKALRIVPPLAVMKDLYRASPEFTIDDDGMVSAVSPLDPEQEVGEVQLAIVRILSAAPNGILDRDNLMQSCHDAGLKLSSVGIYTTYGECIEHVAHNVWAARGTAINASVLAAFMEVSGGRVTPEIETGWLEDGRPWMAFQLTATNVANPSISIPRDLRAVLRDRSFVARTFDGAQCGQIKSDSSGNWIYGWNVFTSRTGADIGDVVRATFDLVTGVATVESNPEIERRLAGGS